MGGLFLARILKMARSLRVLSSHSGSKLSLSLLQSLTIINNTIHPLSHIFTHTYTANIDTLTTGHSFL